MNRRTSKRIDISVLGDLWAGFLEEGTEGCGGFVAVSWGGGFCSRGGVFGVGTYFVGRGVGFEVRGMERMVGYGAASVGDFDTGLRWYSRDV